MDHKQEKQLHKKANRAWNYKEESASLSLWYLVTV